MAANWPTAPGTITKLELKTNNDSDGNTYQVEVQYQYQVGGNSYSGSTLAFGYNSSGGKEIHDQILQKLRQAKSVDVRYDPNKPDSSCLSYGLHRSIQQTLAFAITWLGFSIGFSIIWWLAAQSDDVLLRNLAIR